MRIFLVTALAVFVSAGCGKQSTDSPVTSIPIDDDDIAGVVSSGAGPEAGVWVIAETRDLGTRFIRTVVTDDEGRYLVPDLPDADYEIWVRGYGLLDSQKVPVRPGTSIDLTATVAPTPAAAAGVYPAAYWYAMMDLPTEEEAVSYTHLRAHET